MNQPLTLDERKGLHGRCDVDLEIYYLERLRAILDSPKGYGLRLEFLGISMAKEEQVAFFSSLQQDITQRLLANERHVTDMAAKVDVILERTTAIAQALTSEPSSLSIRFDAVGEARRPTSELDVATVLLIHRLISEGTPAEPTAGQLRAVQVWIGSPDDPVYVPPSPAEVPTRLVDLISWWRAVFPTVVDADRALIVAALARFHYGIVSIHPFLDGNGRLARVLTNQAARDLLRRTSGPN